MIGIIYIDSDKVGEADFKIIDESMGVIGANFIPHPLYNKYQDQIQRLYELQGIAGSQNYNLKVTINDVLLEPFGGVSITDSSMFDEIYVEVAGLDLQLIN